ncbi:MAG: MMPL family transporter [Chloroflexota bacterium]|nr:MMPL family transporter [Chloroflexota bacterium]
MNLKSLTSFCARKPYVVIFIWIILLGLSVFISQNYLSEALSGGDGATIDTESKLANKLKKEKIDLLESSKPKKSEAESQEQTSDNLLVINSKTYKFPSDEYVKAIGDFFIVVQDEIDKSGIEQNIGKVSDYKINPSSDGTTVMMSAPFVRGELVPALMHLLEEYSNEDFHFYFIGQDSIEHTFLELAEKDLVTGETIGISVAIIILALVFGSVTSAFIPVILAIVSITIAVGLISIIGQFVSLNEFVPNIMSMMGLAVGIDYCLFILSRYREERQSGADKLQAVINSGSTAGKAVMFSGLTVVFALVGMFVIPEKTFHALGTGAIVVVFVAVFAGVTLLPAIIGLLGDRVNSFEVPKLATVILFIAGFLFVSITQELGPKLLLVSGLIMLFIILISFLKKKGLSIKFLSTTSTSNVDEGGFWNAITLQVMKRSILSMSIAALFLLVLSYFYFDLEKGTSGISALPDEEPIKVGFELLNEKYGYGADMPTTIVIEANMESEEIKKAIINLEIEMSEDDFFLPPEILIEETVNYAELTSMIPGDPQNQPALNAIKRLRKDMIPTSFGGIPQDQYKVYVGGISAEVVDAVTMTDDYFPIVLSIVLLLSLLLLLLAFRSITISIASIIMNLLSVGASYGLLVLVFQKGFLIDLIGFQQVDQLEFWLPLFMFSILFGLSMDYHVFMLSRIKENFDETNSTDDSVAFGLRRTASIITGAALIMVAVFGGFALGDISFFQSMGFGLGAAVLIDATIVRSILVPSVLKILGTRAWYLPSWLNWLPNISIEGSSEKE